MTTEVQTPVIDEDKLMGFVFRAIDEVGRRSTAHS